MDKLTLEVKFASSEAGTFDGYASLFGGEPDAVGDVIAKGAFTRTLAEHQATGSKPSMFWMHDPAEPIGIWLDLKEDARGLAVKGRLILETTRGREAHALLKAGALNGLSIGYRVRQADRQSVGGRLLQDLDLVEISLVSLPAAKRARITSVKSAAAGTTAAKGAAQQRKSTMPPENAPAADGDPGNATVEERVAGLEETVSGIDTRLASVEEAVGSMKSTAERIEAKLSRPGAALETKGKPEDLGRKAFFGYVRSGRETLPPDEAKALQVGDNATGGYLAPEEFSTELIRDLVEFSPIRQAARAGTTASGSVILPKRTAVTNAQWEGEGEDSEESEPTFGQVEVVTHELRTYTDISNKLLEDGAVNVEAELRTAFAEDFGQKEGLAFVSGSGHKQPQGVLTHADVAYTANGHATNLSADALIGLMYAQPAAYRNRSVWVMNGSTLAAIRKLKDGTTGVYLWQPSYQEGQPETLLGRPVIEAVDMPDATADLYPIVFGDFAGGYRIFDRVGLSVLRDPYSMAKKSLVRFWARRRVGGAVTQAARFRKLKMAIS